MAGVVFIVALFSFFTVTYSATYQCAGVAQYWLTFYGNWSNMTHPNAFPTTPKYGHFSPLVGVSLGNQYTMWEAGMKASQGVKEVAEGGDSTALEAEIMQRIKYNRTAWQQIKSGNMSINGTQSVMNIEVEVTKDFPYVSLVTMLAPSPDWFTGIMKESLCNTSSGMWMESVPVYMLDPWDAGTDNGATFDAGNSATTPAGDITKITKSAPPSNFKDIPGASIPSLGKMMFTRRNKPTMTQCTGEAYYTVKFESKWSQTTHPTGFPANAHFSPLVIATHTYRYKMWSDMTRASPGVKKVAEDGAEGTLDSEVMSMVKPNFVFKVYKTSGIQTPDKYVSMKIMVKDKYSMVSLISMIAPSPDWFVGVDSYDLCGTDGQWKDTMTMNLLPWDAGTDSGQNFSSDNMVTDPVDVIKRITQSSDTQMGAEANVAFATVTFTMEMPTTVQTTKNSAQSLSAGILVLLSIVLAYNNGLDVLE